MSDLQLALLAGGGVFVAAVIAYNAWQERRARGRAEKAFGERPGDALFEPGGGRREPVLGSLPSALGSMPPPSDSVEAAQADSRTLAPEELEAPGGPSAILARTKTPADGVAEIDSKLSRVMR